MSEFKTREDFFDYVADSPELSSDILLGELGRNTLMALCNVKERWAREAIDYVKLTAGSKKLEVAFFAYVRKRAWGLDHLISKFGEIAKVYVKRTWPDYEMYITRNHYGEKLYHLVPLQPPVLEILPKDWTWYQPKKIDGLIQPMITVNLPSKEEITIAPLFDVHYGHQAHKFGKLKAYINWIKETPNVYVILGGDLVENAIDDGRGMSYDQLMAPQAQFTAMQELLAPIAHKILLSVPGNHEARTFNKTGTDYAQLLAERLSIPYVAGPTFLSILANEHHWNFYIWHGKGNAQTRGGKINNASRAKVFTSNIHFFLSGHVHDASVNKETCITPNPYTSSLLKFDQWIIICQSFLAWEDTYAWKAGYAPPASGGTSITLNPEDGSYSGRLT